VDFLPRHLGHHRPARGASLCHSWQRGDRRPGPHRNSAAGWTNTTCPLLGSKTRRKRPAQLSYCQGEGCSSMRPRRSWRSTAAWLLSTSLESWPLVSIPQNAMGYTDQNRCTAYVEFFGMTAAKSIPTTKVHPPDGQGLRQALRNEVDPEGNPITDSSGVLPDGQMEGPLGSAHLGDNGRHRNVRVGIGKKRTCNRITSLVCLLY